MIKIIGNRSIYLVGKMEEVRKQLESIQDKNITVAEFIKQNWQLYKKSLN